MSAIPAELVEAVVRAARRLHQSVAEVPLTAVAEEAGISRRTLLRRLSGGRAALDAAVAERGIDLGRKLPVRERAIAAAAKLIGTHGLGALTLDAVAETADCSVPSLHTVFGGRDGLLTAVFDHFGPLREIELLAKTLPDTVEDRVLALYSVFVEAFDREPKVLPALFADLFARPDGPASRLLKERMPRLLRGLGTLFSSQTGTRNDVPLPVVIQLVAGPLILHMLMRPTLANMAQGELPSVPDVAAVFAKAILQGLPSLARDR